MSSSIIVKPIVVDGIEFYVSPTGEAGMSLSGVGRLCGVDPSNVRRLMERRKNSLASDGGKTAESLDSLDDSVWLSPYLDFRGDRNARVIRDDVCAVIVEYFAYDSEWATDKAKYSYRKFARLGIRAWIHQVTGYAQANDLGKLAETMSLLLKEVQDLRVETREYKAIRKQTETRNFHGLNDLINDLAEADDDVKALPGGDDQGYFTVTEWLSTRGITLDKSRLHRFAAMAAYTYRTMKQEDPPIVYRKSTQASRNKKMNGYLQSDFPILSVALTKTL